MKVFTKDEATYFQRREGFSKPARWADPVEAMLGNCGEVIFPVVGMLMTPEGEPWENFLARNMLESLYRAGYAVVKLDGEKGAVGDLTRAELLAELKAERERRLDGAVAFGEAADAMVNAEHLKHRKEVTDLVTSRDRAVRERDEAREQAALYRRSLEMLASDDLRAEGEAQP